MIITVKYGNTNTYFIKGGTANLLVDTDYAGTLAAFYKALKANGITVSDIDYVPVDDSKAEVISFAESRAFLMNLGIAGEIISTPSHSMDSISVILDDGTCITGDLEPLAFLDAYEDNASLKADWDKILSYGPKRICHAHANEKLL